MNLFNNQFAEIQISYSSKVPRSEMRKITSSRDAFDIAMNIWPTSVEHRESFVVLLLNRANKVLGYSIISTGGLSGTVADPKVIFQVALKSNASSVLILHNHPSGNIQPSDADMKLTSKIKSAGDFLDLPVVDHLIVTNESYYSFADEGNLK